MTIRRGKAVLLLLFVLLSGFLVWIQGRLLDDLMALRRDVDDLKRRELMLTANLSRSMGQIDLYKSSLAEIARYQRALPKDHVEFYSLVERQLTDNNAVVNAIRPALSEGGESVSRSIFPAPITDCLKFSPIGVPWRPLYVFVPSPSISREAARFKRRHNWSPFLKGGRNGDDFGDDLEGFLHGPRR